MNLQWWHFIVLALPILPNLWAIWHVHRHEFSSMQEKAIWLVVATFIPVIGGILYIILGRKKSGNLTNGKG